MIAAHDMEHNDNNRNNEEEDYNEDEDVWNIKDTKLNEETLRKICNNDSSITALSIENPEGFDWESEGEHFGANDKLKCLYISWLESTTYNGWVDVPIDSDMKQITFCSVQLLAETAPLKRFVLQIVT